MWWWVPTERQPEHIQEGPRPVIIVSNNKCNEYSKVVTVVPCTTASKRRFPHQVLLHLQSRPTLALTSQIRTVPKHELLNFKYKLSEEGMAKIEDAIKVQLGL